MRYDLELVSQFCREIGLLASPPSGQVVEVDLGQGAVLYFENAAHAEDDCAIGFVGVASHFHGDPSFMDARGNHIEMDYLDLLIGLKDGSVLICELEVDGRTSERWLIHSKYNDEFGYMQEGERIIVRRAILSSESDPRPAALGST